MTGAESFIIVTYASDLPLHNVVFVVALRLLVIHFVVSHHQQTLLLTSDSVINSPWSVAAECIALPLELLLRVLFICCFFTARDFCLPHLHSTPR